MEGGLMTPYAVDVDLSVPGRLTHWITKGGLRFESRYEPPEGGSAVIAVEWDDLVTAESNYGNARQAAVRRVAKVRARLSGLDADQQDVSQLRTLLKTRRGKLTLYTNTGAPTWWLPKLGLVRKDDELGIKAGWLRGCFVLAWVQWRV
jgi:hypothetical protein